MTVQVHNHIHLGPTTVDPPTTTYYVQHGTLDNSLEVAVAYERGLTGLLHIHRLEDGITAETPVQFDADKETIILRGVNAIGDLATLKALAGRTVYYVANYHDDDENGSGSLNPWGTSSYVKRCILIIASGGVTNVDPSMTMFTVQIQLIDHDKVTG